MDNIIRTENLCFNYTDDETGETTCVLKDISL